MTHIPNGGIKRAAEVQGVATNGGTRVSAKRLQTLRPADAAAYGHCIKAESAVKLQATFRGLAARGHCLAARVRGSSEQLRSNAKRELAAEAEARLHLTEYRQIARSCRSANVKALAELDVRLQRTVGLEPLKTFYHAVRRDCLARAALGDAPVVRNVLISGSMGTGKKTAADIICKLFIALGVGKGMVTTSTTLEQLVLDVRRDVSTVIVEGLVGIEGARAKVDSVLRNFPDHCFVFIGAREAVEALHGAVSHFRRSEPAWLQLQPYKPVEVAEMASQQLRACGYELQPGLHTRTLQQALCATWPRDVLAMRNAHLAKELVQRAVSTRNRRLPLSRLLRAPLYLSEPDLGLDSAQGLQSLLAQRESIEKELNGLVGMAPLKAFLRELGAKVEYVHRGGDSRLLEGCLNVVLTGNPGAGKTTAARLLFRWLRAYGLLQQDVFVERNALELKGTHVGWTCPQVKDMVNSALGGCLFLDEAYALSGGRDGDRGDSFSDELGAPIAQWLQAGLLVERAPEALRTLLTEIENNRSSLCVVLAGYRDAMAHLMRADPGLVRRFPTVLHLDDYSPAELAAIAKATAASRYGLEFCENLEEVLADHIGHTHAAEIAKHNASLAVSLVEAAMNRLAGRLVRAAEAEPEADSPPSRVLVPSDFLIFDESSAAAVARIVQKIDAMPPQLAPAQLALQTLQARLAMHAASAGSELDSASRHDLFGVGRFAILGNVGTDGPEVAELAHELLAAHGVLSTTRIERSALVLAGETPATATAKLQDIVDAAVGGMLVMHDVGALAVDRTAARALSAALAHLPASSGVVLLGLPEEMAELRKEVPGLVSTVPTTIRLPDLTGMQVAHKVQNLAMTRFSLGMLPGTCNQLAEHIKGNLASELASQNGALAEVLLQTAVGHYALRVYSGGGTRSSQVSRASAGGGPIKNNVLELRDFIG